MALGGKERVEWLGGSEEAVACEAWVAMATLWHTGQTPELLPASWALLQLLVLQTGIFLTGEGGVVTKTALQEPGAYWGWSRRRGRGHQDSCRQGLGGGEGEDKGELLPLQEPGAYCDSP